MARGDLFGPQLLTSVQEFTNLDEELRISDELWVAMHSFKCVIKTGYMSHVYRITCVCLKTRDTPIIAIWRWNMMMKHQILHHLIFSQPRMHKYVYRTVSLGSGIPSFGLLGVPSTCWIIALMIFNKDQQRGFGTCEFSKTVLTCFDCYSTLQIAIRAFFDHAQCSGCIM